MTSLASVPAEGERMHQTGISQVSLNFTNGYQCTSKPRPLPSLGSDSPAVLALKLTNSSNTQLPSEPAGVLLGEKMMGPPHTPPTPCYHKKTCFLIVRR